MILSFPRDYRERFIDGVATNYWQQPVDKCIYELERGAVLDGVIWYSHKPRSELDAERTFAIKMYQPTHDCTRII